MARWRGERAVARTRERYVTPSPQSAHDSGRGTEKARATRIALIELAADLFSERGYIDTSIRDIARCAGVTTGAIYGHFRNKADLLAEAINTRTAEELEDQTIG